MIGGATVAIAVLIGIAIGFARQRRRHSGRGRGESWAWRPPHSRPSGSRPAGLFRLSLAAGVTAFLVIATLLIDTLGAALKLPNVILDLSLYKHLGQPIAGIFDPVGIIVAVVMCRGWRGPGAPSGCTRRDIGR